MRQRRLIVCVLTFLSLFLLSACDGHTEKSVHEQNVSMGSVVQITAYGTDEEALHTLSKEALHAVSKLDTNYLSKTLQTSALYKLNHSAHSDFVKVDEPLFSALAKTKEVYAYTNGSAALSSGALTEIWGMDTDEFRVPTDSQIAVAKALCKDDNIRFREDGYISFPDGQILNLGSVGKGMACDTAKESLLAAKENGILHGAVISVGGSIMTLGKPNGKEQFTIGIRDPFQDANSYFAQISVEETFLSTSGTYEKQFTAGGKTYHHLLDLNTGYPKETNLVSVTVSAPSGLLSDALSTLCFLIGEEAARPVLMQYGAEAIFVYADKTYTVTDGLQDAFTLRDKTFQAVTA